MFPSLGGNHEDETVSYRMSKLDEALNFRGKWQEDAKLKSGPWKDCVTLVTDAKCLFQERKLIAKQQENNVVK